MTRSRLVCIVLFSLLSGCVHTPPQPPLIGDLEPRPSLVTSASKPDIDADAVVSRYRDFLTESPDDPAYREALRRLADMELESAERMRDTAVKTASDHAEAQAAIALYEKYLNNYQGDDNNERVLYQLAKAYDLIGRLESSLAVLERLLRQYPDGTYTEEALFRSGEMHFSLRETAEAEIAFKAIVEQYPASTFYERSLYMQGWSLYLENRHQETLQTFFSLLNRKLGKDELTGAALGANLARADRELLEDSLKVICLTLSYLGETLPIDNLLAALADHPYEGLVYRRLGELYLEKDRYGDAANAFLGLARRNPDHALAPEFHQYAIDAYRAGGFRDLSLTAKSRFVALYGVDSRYWHTHDQASHAVVRPYLDANIRELATHFHALARHSKAAQDFDSAISWYREYLKTFPSGAQAAQMNFLLAECLQDGQRQLEAITENERTAYQYGLHETGAEAGYTALLLYWQVLPDLAEEKKLAWRRKAIESALRFSERYPDYVHVDSVLAKATEELFAMHDYAGAIDAARRLLDRPVHNNVEARSNAWIILGHTQFETGDYAHAEQAYQTALGLLAVEDPRKAGLIENLAASIYKQGEQRRAAGDLKSAVALFLKIEQAAPAIWTTAHYDAAAALIELADWSSAATLLEDLLRRGSGDAQLQNGVIEKLVFVYLKSGQKVQAAQKMEALAAATADQHRRKDIIWEAAALYQSLDEKNDAIRLFQRYVAEFPSPEADAIEARYQLSVLYEQQRNTDAALHWSQEIVKADLAAGTARTDRTRRLAGEATLRIAQPQLNAYQDAKLALPLEESLKVKQGLMEQVVATYDKALEYHIAEITTAATYQLGSIYDQFAKAILSSDRPRGLSKDELEQYDLLLEEQAFLFEEQAIKVHEMNLSHISDGIYDKWVENSLRVLATLHPIRYAKTEESETFYDVMQ